MKTPSLRMITAGCFGPGICRTRAIWFFKDVKRTAKQIWPAIASPVIGCAVGSMQTCLRPTFPRSTDGVCTSCVSTGHCCQPAAWRWPQFAAGRDIVIDHRNRSNGLEKVRLGQSEMDTREPEPTQTDVTDQHG